MPECATTPAAIADASSALTPAVDELQALWLFLVDLKRRGFTIGMDEFLAVQHVLLRRAACGQDMRDLAALGRWIAPVICKSLKEQQEFASQYSEWAQREIEKRLTPTPSTATPAPVDAARSTDQLAERARKRTQWWYWIISGLIATILIGVLLVFFQPSTPPADNHLNPRFELQKTPDVDTASGQGKPGDNSNPTPQQPVTGNTPAPIPTGKTADNGISSSALRRAKQFLNSWVVRVGLSGLVLAGLIFMLTRQREAFLVRRTIKGQPAISRLNINASHVVLFRDRALAAATKKLRRHRQQELAVLDVDATVDQTVRTGMFRPVMARRPVSPEYLVLIDRSSQVDHQAALGSALVNFLRGQGLFIDEYYFRGDPRTCSPPRSGGASSHTLDELITLYPFHHLLLLAGADVLVSPISNRVYPWVRDFEAWPLRALLTPLPRGEWSAGEHAVTDAGFAVLPAGIPGVVALGEYFEENRASLIRVPVEREEPMPRALFAYPARWLSDRKPETSETSAMLTDLRRYLGNAGFLWLSACAVYPALQWPITLHLGYTMTDETGQPLSTPQRLVKLVPLPWFRLGRMPAWLRQELVFGMPRHHEPDVRQALQVLLLSAVGYNLGGSPLELARSPGLASTLKDLTKAALGRTDADSPLQERVFVSFMNDKLGVRLPKLLWPMVFPHRYALSSGDLLFAKSIGRAMWVIVGALGMFGVLSAAGLLLSSSTRSGVFLPSIRAAFADLDLYVAMALFIAMTLAFLWSAIRTRANLLLSFGTRTVAVNVAGLLIASAITAFSFLCVSNRRSRYNDPTWSIGFEFLGVWLVFTYGWLWGVGQRAAEADLSLHLARRAVVMIVLATTATWIACALASPGPSDPRTKAPPLAAACLIICATPATYLSRVQVGPLRPKKKKPLPPPPIEGDAEGWWKVSFKWRIVAKAIDAATLFGLFFPAYWFFPQQDTFHNTYWHIHLFAPIAWLVPVIKLRGSPGKWLLRMQVRCADATQAPSQRILIRCLVQWWILPFGVIFLDLTDGLSTSLENMMGLTLVVGAIFWVFDALPAAFKDGRTLRDRLTGTRVLSKALFVRKKTRAIAAKSPNDEATATKTMNRNRRPQRSITKH